MGEKAFPRGGGNQLGMDLFDWFAGMAFTALVYHGTSDPKAIARQAYGYADAMMKHRAVRVR